MAKSKPKKSKEAVVIPSDYHAVIYTDGGCVPNPGYGGYGVHAYTYRETGVNISKYRYSKRATTTGYGNDEVAAAERVSVLDIFSASGVVEPGKATSNNIAEFKALLVAMAAVLDYKPADGLGVLKSVTINLDSQYVLKILEAIYKRHKTRNDRIAYINKPMSDGRPRKNKPYIFQLVDLVELYEKAEVKIAHKWVKGHDGIIGNEEADVLATRGVRINTQMHSRSANLYKGKATEHCRWVDAKTYWHMKSEPNPLIDHNNVIFTNEQRSVIPYDVIEHNGKSYYPYMLSTEADELRAEKKSPPGANGFADEEETEEDDEKAVEGLDGTESEKDADSRYPKVAGRLAHYKASTTRAIVLLTEPLAVVESVFQLYRTQPLYERVMNDLVLVKTGVINSAAFLADYALMGTDALEMQDNFLNHTIYPLSRASLSYGPDLAALHVHPQKVSLYMLDNYREMIGWLSDVINNKWSDFANVEDITDVFYDEDADTGKMVLNPKHKVGTSRIEHVHETIVGYGDFADGEYVDIKLSLVAGIHFPSRNKMKRLEAFNPRVLLVSKQVAYAEKTFASFIFFIVIEADCGIGIYAAEASNLVLKDLSETS